VRLDHAFLRGGAVPTSISVRTTTRRSPRSPVPASRRYASRRAGGIGGPAVGDLMFALGDLPILFRYLLLEPLNFTLLPLHLPLKFFSAGRIRARMPARVCMLAACAPSGPHIHPG
jgi:hypothetical protein